MHHGTLVPLKRTKMSKEKNGKAKNDKTAPKMTLKEKRAAKAAKKSNKSDSGIIL